EQRLTNDSGAAQELTLPVSVADHCDERRTTVVVRTRKQPAERRVQTKRLVVVARDERPVNLRDRFAGADREAVTYESGNAGEDLFLVRQRAHDRVREA